MIEEVLTEVGEGPFGFSRALAPHLREAFADTGAGVELPVLRGRTLIPEGWSRPVVLGHPNHLGRFERVADAPTILLVGRWGGLRAVPSDAAAVGVEEPEGEETARRLLRRARELAKRLTQHHGVRIPFPPESPIVVAILPQRTEAVDGGPSEVTFIGEHHPEFPGGVRIELDANGAGSDDVRYAARLERFVTRGM